MTRPVLWSFRRCPYAMRARLAIVSAGIEVELREVVLRDKPAAFLIASPSATVPCLDLGGNVIDESFDIMLWSLRQRDPDRWLEMPEAGYALVSTCDGVFKTALDRYKYASRYDGVDREAERRNASGFVQELERCIGGGPYLFGAVPRLADMAILPFVRQFAHVDLDWFMAQPWPGVAAWLDRFKSSDRFARIMPKFDQWKPGDVPVLLG